MKSNKARVLLPWETYTLTLGSMQALLTVKRGQYIDGRAIRPLIIRGLAMWVGEKKVKASLTERGYELAKNLETLARLESIPRSQSPRPAPAAPEMLIFYCYSPPMTKAWQMEAPNARVAAHGFVHVLASNSPFFLGGPDKPRKIVVMTEAGVEQQFNAFNDGTKHVVQEV